jgi:UPF0755 protein
MDGFKRPMRPRQQPTHAAPSAQTQPAQQDLSSQTEQVLPPVDISSTGTDSAPLPSRRKRLPFILLGAVFFLSVIAGGALWYHGQLQPVDTSDTSVQRVEVKEGTSFGFVADRLEERGVIRSSIAFRLFAGMEGKQNSLKAGTCNLTPAHSAGQILDKLTTGCHDFKVVTFIPGATLEPSLYAKTKALENSKEFKDVSIRASLKEAGYSDTEITNAFSSKYDSPLFAGKPSSEGFEGYIFGETYYVDVDATAVEVLKVAFDHMYKIVSEERLVEKFKSNGLDLYQGITLASIVERELSCEGKPTQERLERCYTYQQQIARVFYNRLNTGMSLGSDVTSIYASDKLMVASTVDVDSPYNTRRVAGLTPGPIATPGRLALKAVANPSDGDDLYFLAGDDGLIYFAKDEAGHQRNISEHCKTLCGDL